MGKIFIFRVPVTIFSVFFQSGPLLWMETSRYHTVSIHDQPGFSKFALSFSESLLEHLLKLFVEPEHLNDVTFLKRLQVLIHFTMVRRRQ